MMGIVCLMLAGTAAAGSVVVLYALYQDHRSTQARLEKTQRDRQALIDAL